MLKKPIKKKVLEKLIDEMIFSIIQVLFIAFIIYNFIFQLSKVQGSCMEPILFTDERIFVNKFIYRFYDIKRGDIVVFKAPHKPNYDFVKRIIGMPEETIEIKDGNVYIDNNILKEEYINGYMYGEIQKIKIPKDCYFVLGDNRNNSNDSRFWGPVPKSNIRGKVILKFWPLYKISLL